MSTDFQKARAALGTRLRELRTDSRLTGTQLASTLGWPQSKISKLENGRQTATTDDLRVWADATGRPEAFAELHARLKGFESHIRSWRRQLAAGHRPVQDTWNELVAGAAVIQVWENSLVSGMLQTPEYARHVFERYAELHNTPRDTEEAVHARLRRQEWLYRRGRKLRVLMWEPVLHTQICPPDVLAAQLDRLHGLAGLDSVELGIVPLNARLGVPPADAFWVFDGRLAITEDWHAELWLEDEDSIATHVRVWEALDRAAVRGADARSLISKAQRAIG